MSSEYKLNNCPTDGISAVKFSPTGSQFLLTSSWDSSLRLYDITANTQRFQYDHNCPVLDCCFSDHVHAWAGGLDGSLTAYDFNVGKHTNFGMHNDGIRCVEYCPAERIVCTGSWDKTLKLWDPRSRDCIATCPQRGKIYALAVCGTTLITGTSGKGIAVSDLRKMQYMELQRRESSLKYQTRCIKAFPNEEGFVLSSIEGRVAVEYLDMAPEVQKKKYAFKCHRVKENGQEFIYPVHAIAFHNKYSTFATGGADGFVNMWDGFNKKRLCQFHHFPSAISSLAFSNDGSVLAIACSPLYSASVETKVQEDAIFIRHVTDAETKPKTSG